MHVGQYETLTELWHREMENQLFATKKQLDFIASIDTIRYNCVFSCDSMSFEFDLGRDLWLMPARFTVLQREYLDLYQLETFLLRCKEIGLGGAKRGVITSMPSKGVAIRSKKHRWGGCQLGWTFRGGDKYTQPHLTLHSRVAYIAYMGGADLALAYVIAKEIGKRIGKKPKDFSFTWLLDSSQCHFFKSLGAFYSMELEPILIEEGEYPSSKHPTLKGVRKWHQGIRQKYEEGVPLEDEKYGPLRRIRRRYQEYREGIRYSTPVDSLTLNPLRERG